MATILRLKIDRNGGASGRPDLHCYEIPITRLYDFFFRHACFFRGFVLHGACMGDEAGAAVRSYHQKGGGSDVREAGKTDSLASAAGLSSTGLIGQRPIAEV